MNVLAIRGTDTTIRLRSQVTPFILRIVSQKNMAFFPSQAQILRYTIVRISKSHRTGKGLQVPKSKFLKLLKGVITLANLHLLPALFLATSLTASAQSLELEDPSLEESTLPTFMEVETTGFWSATGGDFLADMPDDILGVMSERNPPPFVGQPADRRMSIHWTNARLSPIEPNMDPAKGQEFHADLSLEFSLSPTFVRQFPGSAPVAFMSRVGDLTGKIKLHETNRTADIVLSNRLRWGRIQRAAGNRENSRIAVKLPLSLYDSITSELIGEVYLNGSVRVDENKTKVIGPADVFSFEPVQVGDHYMRSDAKGLVDALTRPPRSSVHYGKASNERIIIDGGYVDGLKTVSENGNIMQTFDSLGQALYACDTGEFIQLGFSGGLTKEFSSKSSPSVPFNLSLQYIPALVLNLPGKKSAVIDGVTGELTVRGQHEDRIVSFSGTNFADKVAMAHVSSTGVSFSLPIEMRTWDDTPVFAVLEAQCTTESTFSTESKCSSISLTEGADLFGERLTNATLESILFEPRAASVDLTPLMTAEAKVKGCNLSTCSLCQQDQCNNCGNVECTTCDTTAGSGNNCCFGTTFCKCTNCGTSFCQSSSVTAIVGTDLDVKASAQACDSHILSRPSITESGTPIVLSDWTVFHKGIVAASSSFRHAGSTKSCTQKAGQTEGLFLAVNHNEHAMNERHMHRPTVSISQAWLQKLSKSEELGRAALRVVVGETEEVLSSEVLYSTSPIAVELRETLADSFLMAYVDDHRHQFTYFAVVEFGSGSARIVDDMIALPKCCPGCPPPPQVCE